MEAEKKSVYLVSCSDHYEHRFRVLAECLRSRGYTVTYLTSDFDHNTKHKYTCGVPGCIQLPARPYRKNLSLERILSHRVFASHVFSYLETLTKQPDLLVMLVPPNFLGYYGAKYCRKHPETRLVFDIFDLWPETFPAEQVKKVLRPAFAVWAWLRNSSLPAADYVLTECKLFQHMLGLSAARSKTVYLSGRQLAKEYPVSLSEEKLQLCYIGGINNVIGIAEICGLLREIVQYKPVTLHIIGAGEQEQKFISDASEAGAETIFYGPVYDDASKAEITGICHFGLNIMKSSVCVGLTMKSVEYFRYGLPIINSIGGDTRELVRERSIGFQLKQGCGEELASVSVETCLRMRQNVQAVFEEFFSDTAVKEQYEAVLDDIL